MSSISFYNSESINMLLSSGLTTRKSNSIFGSQGYAFSGIDLSTLSSIRNGSYHKLFKSYYEKEDNDGTTADRTNKKDTTTDTASQKLNGAAVRDKAADVVDSVSDLKKTALWEKKSVTDKEGNTTKEYDTDAIYKAVSDFVSNYNSLVEKTGKSDDNSVLRNASSMVSYTKANQSYGSCKIYIYRKQFFWTDCIKKCFIALLICCFADCKAGFSDNIFKHGFIFLCNQCNL